ncbi:hypothetical protein RUND412_004126 [Rhizina undulata]
MSFLPTSRAKGGEYIPLHDQVSTPTAAAVYDDPKGNQSGSPLLSENIDQPPEYGYGGYRPVSLNAQGLQTRYTQMKEDDQRNLGYTYSPSRQFWRLARTLLFRWFVTVILCVASAGVMWYYQKRNVLSPQEKRMFNAISVGLGLGLGMNIISAFKAMADMMKWKILATSAYSAREIDLILGLASYQKVTELAMISTGKPLFFFYAICWVLLGIGANIGVALIGLTYNQESDGALNTSPGIVNITNLNAFYNDTNVIPDQLPQPWAQASMAHLYGDSSWNYPIHNPKAADFDPKTQIIGLERIPGEESNCTYHFREFDSASELNHRTNRSVTASTVCQYYPIIVGQFAEDTVNGTIVIGNAQENYTINWIDPISPEATTWTYPGSYNSESPCGPRCSVVYAASFLSSDRSLNPDGSTDDVGHFFSCNTTVSDMTNTHSSNPLHKLPDDVAATAAGSIALTGYISVVTENGEQMQSVRYSSTFLWGRFNGEYGNDTAEAEKKLSQFTAGAIAAMDQYNPKQEGPGDRPWIGVLLVVEWFKLGLILGIIVLVQTVCATATVFIANKVFCKDDSFLSIARLLRPIVERLGPAGCAIDGKAIADTFKTRKMTYGVKSVGNRHHLDIGDDIPPSLNFPAGEYNGEGDWLLAGEKSEESV